jgi:DNA replication and repair protein RecF
MIFVQNLRKFLHSIYDGWLEKTEVIHLRYRSNIRLTTEDFPDLMDIKGETSDEAYDCIFKTYGQAIHNNLDRERQLGTTVVGPHRDDLEVELLGKSLRSFGSQGQQRTAVLALKFAEVYLYFERYAEYSILLLDDVTSELDARRSSKLLEFLQHGMQVFISTTSKPDFSVDKSLSCAHFDLSKSKT